MPQQTVLLNFMYGQYCALLSDESLLAFHCRSRESRIVNQKRIFPFDNCLSGESDNRTDYFSFLRVLILSVFFYPYSLESVY